MQIMTTKDVSAYLNINEKKIYQLVKENEIPFTRVGGKIIFAREIIDRWIYQNTEISNSLLISGSDDLLFREIVDLYNRNCENPAFLATVGSINALKLLKNGQANMSCVHIADQKGEHTVSYLDRYLSPAEYVVIRIFSRKQGILLPADNPYGIKDFKDIFSKELRFTNRNPGSGTRILVDRLMDENGINQNTDNKHTTESLSHIGAAMKVLKGEADATVAIENVARLLGLKFIQLLEEPFELVIPVEQWETRLIKGFTRFLDLANLPRHLQNLPGYDLSCMGHIIWQPK